MTVSFSGLNATQLLNGNRGKSAPSQLINAALTGGIVQNIAALDSYLAGFGASGLDSFTPSFGLPTSAFTGQGLGDVVSAVLFGGPSVNSGLIDNLSGGSDLAQSLADTGKGKKGDILPGLLSSSVGNADLFGGTGKIIGSLYSTIHNPNNKKAFQVLSDITGTDIPLKKLMGKKPK